MEFHVDISSIERLAEKLKVAQTEVPTALARALNHTGAKARTRMIRSLTAQTGLPRKVIVKALQKKTAREGGLAFVIKSKGGNIRLKYFDARETRKGVTAAPWGKRRLYPGAFIKGGRFPNRVALKLNGQVFERRGRVRKPIDVVLSGVFIPKEMVTGATEAAYNSTAASEFPARIEHELSRMLD
jgi:hypothetical protein